MGIEKRICMLDNGPDEATLKNDKKKIVILISIIALVIILIVLFVFLVILSFNQKEEKSKISTTSRRTISIKMTSSSVIPTTTEKVKTEEVTITTKKVTTQRKTTNLKTTSKITEQSTTSTKIIEILPPVIEHETTIDKSTYPDSLDAWEWQIVNLINEQRKKNGLNELLVAKDLRQLAEEAADLWLGSGGDIVKEYLTGHSNYRKYTNYDDVNATSLYNDTVAATKVTTNPALRYLGVGVLYKNDTYYYVIVYE